MKAGLEPKIYEFRTRSVWVDAREGILSSDERKQIEVGCPPEFGGRHGYWTAEHLFVAAIDTCIMTTFRWLFAKARGSLVAYTSDAVGKACIVSSDFRLDEVEIRPLIVVSDPRDVSKAKSAINTAHSTCLISKALNLRVTVTPVVKTDE